MWEDEESRGKGDMRGGIREGLGLDVYHLICCIPNPSVTFS